MDKKAKEKRDMCEKLYTVSGFFAGNTCKLMEPKYLEIFGGLILIFLAIKSIF